MPGAASEASYPIAHAEWNGEVGSRLTVIEHLFAREPRRHDVATTETGLIDLYARPLCHLHTCSSPPSASTTSNGAYCFEKTDRAWSNHCHPPRAWTPLTERGRSAGYTAPRTHLSRESS